MLSYLYVLKVSAVRGLEPRVSLYFHGYRLFVSCHIFLTLSSTCRNAVRHTGLCRVGSRLVI